MEANQTEEEKLIARLAAHFVCPINDNPTTTYEYGMINNLVTFARIVIDKAGYKSPEEVEAIKTAWVVKRTLL